MSPANPRRSQITLPPTPRDPDEAARFLRPQRPPPPQPIPRRALRRACLQPLPGLVAWPLLGGRIHRARHGA